MPVKISPSCRIHLDTDPVAIEIPNTASRFRVEFLESSLLPGERKKKSYKISIVHCDGKHFNYDYYDTTGEIKSPGFITKAEKVLIVMKMLEEARDGTLSRESFCSKYNLGEKECKKRHLKARVTLANARKMGLERKDLANAISKIEKIHDAMVSGVLKHESD